MRERGSGSGNSLDAASLAIIDNISSARTSREARLLHARAIRSCVLNEKYCRAADDALAAVLDSVDDDATDLMTQAQEVAPGLFLGPFAVARDQDELRRLGITHIVCLSAEGSCDIMNKKINGNFIIKYLEHPLVEVDCTLERGAQMIADVVPSCVDFVREALLTTGSSGKEGDSSSSNKNGRVLIHCLHGRTRSAAVASCCRAELLGETFCDAYNVVKSKRDVYVPEEWFGILENTLLRTRKTVVPTTNS